MPMRLEKLGAGARDAKRTDLALAIYERAILPEARNPEREILYWIEHGHQAAHAPQCFAIEDQDEVVGYLQYSFFPSTSCAFLEYVCVRAESRRSGRQLAHLFKDELSRTHPDWTAIAGELAFKRTPSFEWERDATLIRLARRHGFRRLNLPYRYPSLNSKSSARSHPGDLVIALRSDENVTPAYALDLIRCIYYQHYLAWDRPFLAVEKLAEREGLISQLMAQQVSAIGDRENIIAE